VGLEADAARARGSGHVRAADRLRQRRQPLLAQGSSRRQEFAVRAARGASRWRIARQLVAEGIVIAVFGGTTGLAVAWDATALLEGVLPGSIVFAPFRDSGNGCLDPWVLGFTFGMAVLTGLLFSLAPIVGLKPGAASDLNAARDRSSTGRLTAIRESLVAAEVGLALVVLVAARGHDGGDRA
jgi:putative ABC transport system permease protein